MIGELNKNTQGTQMVIIAERSRMDIDVEFLDEHHYIKEHTAYSNFKSGRIKNPFDKTVMGIGYVGVGKNKLSLTTNKNLPEYKVWYAMIERNYCDKNKELHPAYYGVSEICDEWLCYQNFADWYKENKYECDGRLHLDKDIKYPGNKIYSPYHCLLVPQKINVLFTNKGNKRGLPNGVRHDYNKYYARYASKELGGYDNLEDAYIAYGNAKKKAIIKIANEYKDKIPNDVYDALLRYEVRIENDKNFNNCNQLPI